MKLAIFITCRNNSTRLPNKALLNLYNDTTYIDYIFQRVHKVKTDCVKILCTTYGEENQILIDKAIFNNCLYFIGDEKDKLNRWFKAATFYNIDFFVTVDGDDPFFDFNIVDLAFNKYLKGGYDFIKCSDIIPGLFTYGIKYSALKKVCEIKDTDDTEMMWVFFENLKNIKIKDLNKKVDKKLLDNEIRLTLDYIEDHNFMSLLISKYQKNKLFITSIEIIEILGKFPELKLINKDRISEWMENQKNKTVFKIKNEKK